jgi:hypothetical protein
MRNYLLSLLAMVAMAFVACEPVVTPDDNTPATPTLELTSTSTLRVNRDGGNFDITYTLTNGTEGESVKVVVVNSTMITATDASREGIVTVTISENTTDAVREGAVIVSYGALSFTVVVAQDYAVNEQPEERIEIEANQLIGAYYGENLMAGVGHYVIALSRDGFVDGNVVAGGEYFRLDLVAPVAEDLDNITLPDGEYRLDFSLNYDSFTIISTANTDYMWIDENMGAWSLPMENATLNVNGNNIVLDAVIDGKECRVTYNGEYSLTPSIITEYISSLTKDTVIDVSNCTAAVKNYGDYWDCGCQNWGIEFVCNDGLNQGTYLVLDLLNNSTTNFAGTYIDSGFTKEDETKPDFRADVFVPGFRVSDNADLLLGSLFMVYKDGVCISQAPLYEGTITIEAKGNGMYTINIDALDDAPKQNKITLTWTGKL